MSIEMLTGKTVYARASCFLAVDGEATFIAEGEPRNARERVVKVWPDMFAGEPPQVTVEGAV
jgi:hypothetical protein